MMATHDTPFAYVSEVPPGGQWSMLTSPSLKPTPEKCLVYFKYQLESNAKLEIQMVHNDQFENPTIIWSSMSFNDRQQGYWFTSAVDIGKVKSNYRLSAKVSTIGRHSEKLSFAGIRDIEYCEDCFVKSYDKVSIKLMILTIKCNSHV